MPAENLQTPEQIASQNKNRKTQIKEQIAMLAEKVRHLSQHYLRLHDLSHGNKGMAALRAEAKMKKRSIMATRKKIYKLERELKSL